MEKTNYSPLSPEQVSGIAQSVADLLSNLPTNGALTVTDRRRLSKLGPNSLQFVQQTVDIAKQNPGLLPGFVSKDDLIGTFEFYNQMLNLHLQVKQLERLISDLKMESGNSAYSKSRIAYHSIKKAADNNVAGALSVYDALKTRFKPSRRKKEDSDAGMESKISAA